MTQNRVPFNLKKYLRDFDKALKSGACVKCGTMVQWSFKRLKGHKTKCIDPEFQAEVQELGLVEQPVRICRPTKSDQETGNICWIAWE